MALDELDDRLVAYLDANAKAARIAAWVVCFAQALFAVYSVVAFNPIGIGLGLVSSLIIFWLLVKTRPVAVAKP